MKYFSLILTIMIYQVGFGQNLVLNGDFEDCNCPKAEAYTSMEACKNVKALVNSSPDYFNYCSDFYNPVNPVFGSQPPFSGNGYAGLILLNNNNPRIEYITLALERPLEPICYELSLRISWADCSSLKIDKLGFLLTDDSEKLKCKKYVITEKSRVIDLTHPRLDDKSAWNEIGTIFCASGGENELVFGTFKDGLKSLVINQTKIEHSNCFNSSNSNWAYYFIDDVRLVPLGEAKEGDETNFTHQ